MMVLLMGRVISAMHLIKGDNRIRLVHQDNKGLSAARNVGLKMMTGDAITFLNPDDVFHPDYIKAMVSAIKRDRTDLDNM